MAEEGTPVHPPVVAVGDLAGSPLSQTATHTTGTERPQHGMSTSTVGLGVSRVATLRRAVASAWRWPERPGEMPLYVQRNFRVKAYALTSFQMAVIWVEMVVVRLTLFERLGAGTPNQQVLFWCLGLAVIPLTMWLHAAKDVYPLNYVLLLCTTLLVGPLWGLSAGAMGVGPVLGPALVYHPARVTFLHFQVMGMLAVAMAVSAVVVAVSTREGIGPRSALLIAHSCGWLVASGVDLLLVYIFGFCYVGWAVVAVFITFVLMMGIVFVEAGNVLAKGNPDDSFRVMVNIDCVLFVVSLPIFLVVCCMVRVVDLDQAAAEQLSARNVVEQLAQLEQPEGP